MSCQFTKFAYFAVKLRHVVAYGYYLKLFIWIHVWIALNKFNHCYQLFNHVLYLDIYWSISDTAGLLFYLPVNNSGWTCYYQLQRFLFHLGLHLVHSINASCSVSTHDLLLPTTTITILIMGFNSHWNSVTMWLTIANYQAIIPIVDFILCSVRTHIYHDTNYRHGLFHIASTSSCPPFVVTIQIGY